MISALNKYTCDDLRKLGFGPESIRIMRESGIVVPSEFRGRLWYSGKEIIDFLDSKKMQPGAVKANKRNSGTFTKARRLTARRFAIVDKEQVQ